MLFISGHCLDVFPPAATVVTTVCSNVCHVSCFWRRRQGTWPSYLENWGKFHIFGCSCFQLEARLYIDRTATAWQQTCDTIFLPVLDFWIALVARMYPIYRTRTGVIMFAEHSSFWYTCDRWFSKSVAKWVCKRLGRNYISSRSWNPLEDLEVDRRIILKCTLQ